MIKKINGQYFVFNHDGTKKLSKAYTSNSEAEERLKQIEGFKHMSESMQVIFESEDFKFELKEAEDKSKFLKIEGTALTVGKSKNGRNYSYKNLQENALTFLLF